MQKSSSNYLVSLAWALIIALVTLARTPASCASVSKLLELQGGFKVKARVVMNGNKEEIGTTEYYSNEQQRSRIDINGNYAPTTMHSGNRFTYHYDSRSRQLLKITDRLVGGSFCFKMDSILYDLFGDAYQTDRRLKEWLGPVEGVPDYVNGLARLLLIVEANKESMRKVQSTGWTTVRNHRAQNYQIDLYDWGGARTHEKLVVDVWYAEDSYAVGLVNLPLRIYFRSSSPTSSTAQINFFIDYSFLEELSPLSATRDTDYHLDRFSFPVGLDCSKQMGATKSLETAKIPQVVSMQLEVEDVFSIEGAQERSISRHFVAYDGHQKALRQDTIKTSRQDGLSVSVYSTTIHDFKTNKYYNIRRELADDDDDDDGWLDKSDKDKTGNKDSGLFNRLNVKLDNYAECAVARTSSRFDFNSLLPLRELTDMGVALVRGIKTRVLEHVTQELPAVLFQQVLFMNQRQQEVFTFNPAFNLGAKSTESLTVVYYVAHDFSKQEDANQLIGPLIRVDIFHEFRKIYQVDVYDLVWQLAEAPNGDHQTELFSVKDNCPGFSGQAEETLTVELELLNGVEEAQRLLDNPLIRNKAIQRALIQQVDSSSLTAINLNGLESRLRLIRTEASSDGEQAGGKLQALASAKVANVRDQLFIATSAGSVASLREGARPSETSATFAECYWEAAHARSRGPVVFSFYNGRCFVDYKPKMKWDDKKKANQVSSSQVFNIDSSKKGELRNELIKFRMEQDEKSISAKTSQWDIYDKLFESVLRLPIVSLEAPNRTLAELAFQVTRVEVSNNKWGTRGASGLEACLNGLGLAGGIEHSHSQEASQLDLTTCQSICMADLTCRAYSVCVTGQGIECRTTSSPFTDPKLLTLISKKLKEDLKQSRNIVIDFKATQDNQPTDEELEHNPAGSAIYQLKVDNRCRIYGKRALELFKELPKTLTSLENRNIRQVDNEEQCAELCLEKNVKFFRLMANMRLMAFHKDDLLSENSGQYWEKVDKTRQQYAANLKSWCSTFKYLNLRATSLRNVDYQLEATQKAGICLLSQPVESKQVATKKPPSALPQKTQTKVTKTKDEKNKKAEKAKAKAKKIKLDTFEFIYKNLFRMQPGVRLLQFDLDADNATGQMGAGGLPTAINRQKVVEMSDLELCSRYCFTQSVGLAPFCKSFDVVEVRTELPADGNRSTTERRLKLTNYCVFNSITLSEAQKSASQARLVSTSVEANTRVFHYEPRDEFMLDAFVMAQLLDRETKRAFGFSVFNDELNLFLVVLVGIISGLLLGHYARGFIGQRWPSSSGPNIPVDSPLDGLIDEHQADHQHDDL